MPRAPSSRLQVPSSSNRKRQRQPSVNFHTPRSIASHSEGSSSLGLVYRLPIPSNKLEKACNLYKIYKFEKQLEFENGNSQASGSTSQSRTFSITTGTSVSKASTAAELTNGVRIIDFGHDSDLASTGIVNEVSFKGEKVKSKRRSPLSPATKAKAALLRFIGACTRCRERKVPCPLDHHDIDSLELASQAADEQPLSMNPNDTVQLITGIGARHNSTYEIKSVEALIHEPDDLLYAPDAVSGTETEMETRPSVRTAAFQGQDLQDPETYGQPEQLDGGQHSEIQDDGDFLVGAFELTTDNTNKQIGRFTCAYREECDKVFSHPAELQDHFAKDHFGFIQLKHPYRYKCSICGGVPPHVVKLLSKERCSYCTLDGFIELSIWGRSFHNRSFDRYDPDNQPVGLMDNSRHQGDRTDGTISESSLLLHTGGVELDRARDAESNSSHTDTNNSDWHPDHPQQGHGHFYMPDQGFDRYQGPDYPADNLNIVSEREEKTSTAAYKVLAFNMILLLVAVLDEGYLLWIRHLVQTMTRPLFKTLSLEQGEMPPMYGFLGIVGSITTCWLLKHHPKGLKHKGSYVSRKIPRFVSGYCID